MKTNANVAVPTERAAQLRQLAADLGNVSMSAVLAQLFKAARETGLIRDLTLPGVDVHALADGIVIQFDQTGSKPYRFDAARALAATVRQFATGENTAPLIVDVDHNFSVQRKGSGIVVVIDFSDTAPKKAFNADLAIEFAELIESAVNKKDPQ